MTNKRGCISADSRGCTWIAKLPLKICTAKLAIGLCSKHLAAAQTKIANTFKQNQSLPYKHSLGAQIMPSRILAFQKDLEWGTYEEQKHWSLERKAMLTNRQKKMKETKFNSCPLVSINSAKPLELLTRSVNTAKTAQATQSRSRNAESSQRTTRKRLFKPSQNREKTQNGGAGACILTARCCRALTAKLREA